MAEILVLANETIGGEKLLNAVRDRHAQGDARFYVVVPLSRPRHGNVIYDHAERDSAQVRRRPRCSRSCARRQRGRGAEVGRRRPLERRAGRDRRARDHSEHRLGTCPSRVGAG
jgi:hypothetical protein